MKATCKIIMGNSTYQFDFEENKDLEAMHKAIAVGNVPTKCDECGNVQAFKMDTNKDKESNIYINVICRKCGAKAKLGQYKAGGYFWHKFEKYIPKQESTGSSFPDEPEQSPEPPDDLPF